MFNLIIGLTLFNIGLYGVTDYTGTVRIIASTVCAYGLQVVIAARIKIERGKP